MHGVFIDANGSLADIFERQTVAQRTAHLPCTWPKRLKDSPAHFSGKPIDYPGVNGSGDERGKMPADPGPQEKYSEGILVGYRWFDAKNIEPQFPFGFGLTYTTFELSGLRFSDSGRGQAAGLHKPIVTVHAKVANTGPRNGARWCRSMSGRPSRRCRVRRGS